MRPFQICFRFVSGLWLVTSLLGCPAEGVDTPTPDPSATAEPEVEEVVDEDAVLFSRDELHHVDVAIDPFDWAELRQQTRSWLDIFVGEDCLDRPFTKPFTWFVADEVTVDGAALSDVGIRKKGFFGSLNDDKPSLKLRFDREVDEQRLLGRKRLTLNNAVQDPAVIRQCLAYDLFADAGVPAPRCAFATVDVNGTPKGVYVVLEDIRKPFLRRHFSDDEGVLLEGTISDFRDGWTTNFERKTNDNEPTDLVDRFIDVLDEEDDDVFLQRLDTLLDLDTFMTFWAMEVLIEHWDGYAGNTNNFFLYEDPTTSKTHFLPWGTDGTFGEGEAYTRPNVFAEGRLVHRLLGISTTRTAYHERLRELRDALWDADALVERIDAMADLIAPGMPSARVAEWHEHVDRLRTAVRSRAMSLNNELPLPGDELRPPFCMVPTGEVNGSASSTWSSQNPGAFTATFDGTDAPYDGTPLDGQTWAGIGEQGERFVYMSHPVGNDDAVWLYLALPPEFTEQSVEFVLGEDAALYWGDSRVREDPMGFTVDGTVGVEAGERSFGQEVNVTFEGDLVQW